MADDIRACILELGVQATTDDILTFMHLRHHWDDMFADPQPQPHPKPIDWMKYGF